MKTEIIPTPVPFKLFKGEEFIKEIGDAKERASEIGKVQISTVKLELFVELFKKNGYYDAISVNKLEDLHTMNEDLYEALEKEYTEDVLGEYRRSSENPN